MIWEIRQMTLSYCWRESGATLPVNMFLASVYQISRCMRMSIKIDFNPLGYRFVAKQGFPFIGFEKTLPDLAAQAIIDTKTPVIIGTGWLSHYPLAYGYKFRSRKVKACKLCWWTKTEHERYFFVNQGWGGNNNGWVPASTWFVGQYM